LRGLISRIPNIDVVTAAEVGLLIIQIFAQSITRAGGTIFSTADYVDLLLILNTSFYIGSPPGRSATPVLARAAGFAKYGPS
jgi:hypothetical protein